MIADFYRTFKPTDEERTEDRERYRRLCDKLKTKKGCSTCRHCKHVVDYPDFVLGEECTCEAGLECDTVLFSVVNCECWEEEEE